MPKRFGQVYSHYALEAIVLLGKLIRAARKERKISAQELAERAGVSRSFVQRLEKGDPKCELGASIELAAIVGVRLFDAEAENLNHHIERTKDKLVWLPKSARKPIQVIDDDF